MRRDFRSRRPDRRPSEGRGAPAPEPPDTLPRERAAASTALPIPFNITRAGWRAVPEVKVAAAPTWLPRQFQAAAVQHRGRSASRQPAARPPSPRRERGGWRRGYPARLRARQGAPRQVRANAPTDAQVSNRRLAPWRQDAHVSAEPLSPVIRAATDSPARGRLPRRSPHRVCCQAHGREPSRPARAGRRHALQEGRRCRPSHSGGSTLV